jgi:hypothetical protein
MNDYHGLPTRHLASGSLELDCLETAGPRIVGLRYRGSENLLAEVPGISVPTVYGDYHYIGGHRLWYAPEGMPRSYVPDNDGLIISETSSSIILDGKTEAGTGIHKRIEIRLNPNQPQVSLTHTLINEGLWEVELAPWAITMFRLGGIAILPSQIENPNLDDLLPNRHFSLWAYSQIKDARLQFEDGFVTVTAKPDLPPFKIGTFNPRGWIAYWLDGILFRKTFTVQAGLPHPDYGCNAEIYCDSHFIELESLAPLTTLAPDQSVSFTETWELYDKLEQDFMPDKFIELNLAGRQSA